MWSKAPERVFVLANLPQVHAEAIEIEYLAQLACLDELAEPLDGRVIDEEVAGEYRDAPLSGLPGHGLGIAYTEGKRLLDQHRLARLQHLLGDGCMGCGWGSHDHGVHDAEQRGHVARHEGARVLPRQSLSHFLVGVADRRKLAFGQAGDRADVIAPTGSSDDYAELQPLHRYNPCIASTTRSSCAWFSSGKVGSEMSSCDACSACDWQAYWE